MGNGNGKGEETFEIRPKDVEGMQKFLAPRFNGVYPALMFLACYSGALIGQMEKQPGVTRDNVELAIANFRAAFDAAYKKAAEES